jgi:TRAP-type mannitol/chloroaromatic compound transport system permease small subunit
VHIKYSLTRLFYFYTIGYAKELDNYLFNIFLEVCVKYKLFSNTHIRIDEATFKLSEI